MRSEFVKSIFNDDPELLALFEKRRHIQELPSLKGNDGLTPSDEHLIELIKPLIPEPIKGNDYVLTREDKREIAAQIELPIVEKVIEKYTEVIRELPMITETTEVVKETSIVKEELTITPELVKDIIKVMSFLPENDRLDVSKLRNANSFIFGGKKYQIAELMHGGGSSAGGVIPLAYDISAQFNGIATTFTLPTYSAILSFTITGWPPDGNLRPAIDFTTPTNTTVVISTTAPVGGTTGIILYIPV